MGHEISVGMVQILDSGTLTDIQTALDRMWKGLNLWTVTRQMSILNWPTADQLETKKPLAFGCTIFRSFSVIYHSDNAADREENWSITFHRTKVPHISYNRDFIYDKVQTGIEGTEKLLQFLVETHSADLAIWRKTWLKMSYMGEAFAIYIFGKMSAIKKIRNCWREPLEGDRSIIEDFSKEVKLIFVSDERTSKIIQIANRSDFVKFTSICDDLLVQRLGDERLTELLNITGISAKKWIPNKYSICGLLRRISLIL